MELTVLELIEQGLTVLELIEQGLIVLEQSVYDFRLLSYQRLKLGQSVYGYSRLVTVLSVSGY
jgi:hypothetical protein